MGNYPASSSFPPLSKIIGLLGLSQNNKTKFRNLIIAMLRTYLEELDIPGIPPALPNMNGGRYQHKKYYYKIRHMRKYLKSPRKSRKSRKSRRY
jgi:hypothetical protein